MPGVFHCVGCHPDQGCDFGVPQAFGMKAADFLPSFGDLGGLLLGVVSVVWRWLSLEKLRVPHLLFLAAMLGDLPKGWESHVGRFRNDSPTDTLATHEVLTRS